MSIESAHILYITGRGVVAARDFKEGDYLTYYHGQHSLEEPSNDDKTYLFRINNDGNISW